MFPPTAPLTNWMMIAAMLMTCPPALGCSFADPTRCNSFCSRRSPKRPTRFCLRLARALTPSIGRLRPCRYEKITPGPNPSRLYTASPYPLSSRYPESPIDGWRGKSGRLLQCMRFPPGWPSLPEWSGTLRLSFSK